MIKHNSNFQPPCSNESLKTTTGLDWAQWCKRLDADNAMELEHKELALLIDSMHNAGSWWSQTIAVGYERFKGKRSIHQRGDSSFTMSTSKTVSVGAAKAHTYFVESRHRSLWLKEKITIRTATAPKSVRITWPDKTSVAIWITAKGDNKCSISVEHSKLASQAAVAEQKQFWKAALQRLADVVT